MLRLKPRTIALLVAGTLVGAQAVIAASEHERTAMDTITLTPAEVVTIEPVTLSDQAGNTADYVVIESTPVIIAEVEPAGSPAVVVTNRVTYVAPERPAQMDLTAFFKGHPSSPNETAGSESAAGSAQFAHSSSASYRMASASPSSVSETAGFTQSEYESMRLAQSRSDTQLASAN